MNKNKKIGFAVLALIILPMFTVGAFSSYKAFTLFKAERNVNYSNGELFEAKEALVEKKEAVKKAEIELVSRQKKRNEDFCFLVDMKKNRGNQISPESEKEANEICNDNYVFD